MWDSEEDRDRGSFNIFSGKLKLFVDICSCLGRRVVIGIFILIFYFFFKNILNLV